MLTRWGHGLARGPEAVPHPEHPRPQLVRASWSSLNGWWQHAVGASEVRPARICEPILVPFSPEAPLSGVGRQLRPEERLWYRRRFTPPPVPDGGRLLLHLGAVDQRCTVWVDGREVGSHVGGYLPFTLDVTAALRPGAVEHELLLRVRDLSETGWHARGKQRLDRGQIWYTAQSGIWQSVWLETVPAAHVTGLVLDADLATDSFLVTVQVSEPDALGSAAVSVDGAAPVVVPVGVATPVPVPDPRRWTPERPVLHPVSVVHGEDRVESYGALRTVGTGRDEHGQRRLLLNGEPYPHVGVLDQGYWPDGLLTPPSDAAVVADLERVKRLGFTMVRKHAKVEPLRWYHHCDRLGLLVWQDVVNGGGRYRHLVAHRARHGFPLPDRWHRLFGRDDARGRAELLDEVRATVALLRSSPAVVAWTPFNEGWGQFDATGVADLVRGLDPTRVVHHASGWVDQGGGDVRSFHRYEAPFTMPRSRRLRRLGRRDRRVVALTEYGGHSLAVPGHVWGAEEFGYRRHADAAALAAAFGDLHHALEREAGRGLAATVWTQLTDVEDELNGLVTYDREVEKLDADLVRRTTAALARAMVPGWPG